MLVKDLEGKQDSKADRSTSYMTYESTERSWK